MGPCLSPDGVQFLPGPGLDEHESPRVAASKWTAHTQRLYHYTRKDYRTKLYYLRMVLGNSCYQTDSVLELICLGNMCEQWITEFLGLPYRNVLGIVFGNIGRGDAEPKPFWN